MADLAIPKKGAPKRHPMQDHLDSAKKAHDAMDNFFRSQMEMQMEVDAEEARKNKKSVSPLGGEAK